MLQSHFLSSLAVASLLACSQVQARALSAPQSPALYEPLLVSRAVWSDPQQSHNTILRRQEDDSVASSAKAKSKDKSGSKGDKKSKSKSDGKGTKEPQAKPESKGGNDDLQKRLQAYCDDVRLSESHGLTRFLFTSPELDKIKDDKEVQDVILKKCYAFLDAHYPKYGAKGPYWDEVNKKRSKFQEGAPNGRVPGTTTYSAACEAWEVTDPRWYDENTPEQLRAWQKFAKMPEGTITQEFLQSIGAGQASDTDVCKKN